jgi:hypothetical protein
MHHWQINLWRWHFHWLWSYHFDKWRDDVTLKDLRKDAKKFGWDSTARLALIAAYRRRYTDTSIYHCTLIVDYMLDKEKGKL